MAQLRLGLVRIGFNFVNGYCRKEGVLGGFWIPVLNRLLRSMSSRSQLFPVATEWTRGCPNSQKAVPQSGCPAWELAVASAHGLPLPRNHEGKTGVSLTAPMTPGVSDAVRLSEAAASMGRG